MITYQLFHLPLLFQNGLAETENSIILINSNYRKMYLAAASGAWGESYNNSDHSHGV